MVTALDNITLGKAVSLLQSGNISSLDLTKHCLDRIEKLDPQYGCFLARDADRAVRQAKQSDERRAKKQEKGKLDGIPIALKDMILTKGLETTAGSRILEGFIPCYDATVTTRLVDQGAVLLGKLNQDEFAMGSSNETSAYKPCKNPWDVTRTPGGSSGGSAASVALGMCLGSLGTDTGGSIRQPAAFCGVVGLKPTYGRVSRYGVIAYASSLDQVGPFGTDVESTALLLHAIAGHDPLDSTSANHPVEDYANGLRKPITGLRVGVPKEYMGDGIDADVRTSVEQALQILQRQGAVVQPISLPHTPYAVATYYVIATAEASSNLSRYDGIRYGQRRGEKEGLLALYHQTRGQLFGPEVKRRIMLGAYVLSTGFYDAYYVRAQKVRDLFQQDFTSAFNDVDVILCPTTPTTAFSLGAKVEDPLQMYLNDIFTIGANLAGLPGLSLPTGFSKTHLPIGTQLIGKPFAEQQLLNVASVLEAELSLDLFPKVG